MEFKQFELELIRYAIDDLMWNSRGDIKIQCQQIITKIEQYKNTRKILRSAIKIK